MEENKDNNRSKEEVVLTKRERNQIRKEEKQKATTREIRRRKIKKVLVWVIIILLIAAATYGVIISSRNSEEERLGDQISIVSREHVQAGVEHEGYNSNPPTSGPHYSQAPNWGIYDELVDEQAIHSMEHGGIWISYKNLDNSSIESLETIARKFSRRVILSPREANESNIAIASWGRLMTLDKVDVETIESYIKSNTNKSPERLAQ